MFYQVIHSSDTTPFQAVHDVDYNGLRMCVFDLTKFIYLSGRPSIEILTELVSCTLVNMVCWFLFVFCFFVICGGQMDGLL